MENNIFKILHAYHPNGDSKFEKADILVYQSDIILAGYEKAGETMSSFLHYQFNDIKLPSIYSTQLQMAQDTLPLGYQNADLVKVYHCESDFVLIPNSELRNVQGYQVFAEQYSEPAEKLLYDNLDSIEAREYYNYPFRVYNDLFFAFQNAKFYSEHRPIFEALKKKSIDRNLVYVSVKSKHVEIICFRDGILTLDNMFKATSPEDILRSIDNAMYRLQIDSNSSDLMMTCVRKENKDQIMSLVKSQYPNCNADAQDAFGFPLDFWEIYGDLILCS